MNAFSVSRRTKSVTKTAYTLRATPDDSAGCLDAGCRTHRTTWRHRTMSYDVVRCRPATYMQIICKYPNNMAADVADVVVASAIRSCTFSKRKTMRKNVVVGVYGVDHGASAFTAWITGENYVTKVMHDSKRRHVQCISAILIGQHTALAQIAVHDIVRQLTQKLNLRQCRTTSCDIGCRTMSYAVWTPLNITTVVNNAHDV